MKVYKLDSFMKNIYLPLHMECLTLSVGHLGHYHGTLILCISKTFYKINVSPLIGNIFTLVTNERLMIIIHHIIT